MKTMLSAVQPSNQLTLGNYLGALKGWVEMQSQYNCLFFAVDLHAITVRQDPAKLREQTYTALATYFAAGIRSGLATVFVQSHVRQHAELAWILTCFSSMGELSRMTQFKDKAAKLGDNEGIGVGLFSYPVLMAADILLYQTDVVPVGDDQRQHLQLARDLAVRVNNYVGDTVFKVPEPIIPKIGARIMSLQDPTKKMSKSDPDPLASVFLLDSDDDIAKKFKKAVTDSGSEVTYDETKPGVLNLLHINAALQSRSIEEVVASFAGKQYGHLKKETADLAIHTIGPMREKILDILGKNPDFPALTRMPELNRLLKDGAVKAQVQAERTLNTVYEKLGFVR